MPDWVWNSAMDWGPVARDFLSVFLAALGSFLAYQAIKLGREQNEMSKRQAEIAETEHQIQQDLLSRRAVAAMDLSTGIQGLDPDASLFRIQITNSGSRTISDYAWEIHCPIDMWQHVKFRIEGARFEKLPMAVGDDDKMCRMVSGESTSKVYPGRTIELGQLDVRNSIPPGKLQLFWQVVCEDGTFPNAQGGWGTMTARFYEAGDN